MLKNIKEIVTLILVILALGVSAWCFLLKNITVHERLLTEDNLFDETIISKKAQEKLSRAEKEKEGLQANVNQLMLKAQALDQEIAGYKNTINASKRQLSSINNSSVLIGSEMTLANSNVNNLKNRITYITTDALKVSGKLELLTKTRDALQERLAQYTREEYAMPIMHEARNDIPEPAIRKSVASLAEEPVGSFGEVLTVNREYAFLVISLGERDGITEGMVFNIQRDNQNLGQIRVETVRENISAAALIDKNILSEIRAGDMVSPRYEI